MIRKEQVRIGMRIVGDDPESPESYPYKGTVTALCETGRNETDFYIVIKLDGESMRQPEISRCCPEGIMRCFPGLSVEEKPEKRNNIPSTAYTTVETSWVSSSPIRKKAGGAFGNSFRKWQIPISSRHSTWDRYASMRRKVYLLISLRSIRRKSPCGISLRAKAGGFPAGCPLPEPDETDGRGFPQLLSQCRLHGQPS